MITRAKRIFRLKSETHADGIVKSMKENPDDKATNILPGDVNDCSYRLSTLAKYPYQLNLSPETLSGAGFYYTGSEEVLKCAGCGNYVGEWQYNDDPSSDVYHKHNCKFYSATSTNEEMDIITEFISLENPASPHMKREATRLETFNIRFSDSWPEDRVQASPRQIAGAGFFYLGERDRVKCWYCNGGLENWEHDDEPWTEHAKWFPHCEFLLKNKGFDFIHAVTSRHPNLVRPTVQPRRIVINSGNWTGNGNASHGASSRPFMIDPREELRKREKKIEEIMNQSSLVKQAQDMGYTNERIRRAITWHFQAKDRNCDSIDELLDTLHPNNEDEAHQNEASNYSESCTHAMTSPGNNDDETASKKTLIWQIEEERKCKICKNENSNVVFVPCGHLAGCAPCSNNTRNCPICLSYIRQKIRAYIS